MRRGRAWCSVRYFGTGNEIRGRGRFVFLSTCSKQHHRVSIGKNHSAPVMHPDADQRSAQKQDAGLRRERQRGGVGSVCAQSLAQAFRLAARFPRRQRSFSPRQTCRSSEAPCICNAQVHQAQSSTTKASVGRFTLSTRLSTRRSRERSTAEDEEACVLVQR